MTIESDEFPESRETTLYAINKRAAIDSRLLHFPRAEITEVSILERARAGRNGKYFVRVSEDLD